MHRKKGMGTGNYYGTNTTTKHKVNQKRKESEIKNKLQLDLRSFNDQ
jgi:hypothetical protein